MEKTRKIRTLNLLALIVAVLGLTVAFAALSKTLTINGTANVDAASWDVRYISISDAFTSGAARELESPKISSDGSKIQNINVSLTRPGDFIGYTFIVENKGTIDAKYASSYVNGYEWNNETISNKMDEIIESMYPVCDWDGNGETEKDERINCVDNIFLTTSFTNTAVNFVLKSGETIGNTQNISDFFSEPMFLYISYDESSSELPKGDVRINIDFAMKFVQN